MTLPILQPMRGLLELRSHHMATCWKIERTDSVIFRFTDHDLPIVLEGETYLSAASVNASARQKTSGLNPSNLQFVGILDNDLITTEDLRAGKYREAKITETVVDSRFPWAGVFSQSTYWVVSTVFTGSVWTANISGMGRLLQPPVGRVYSKNCPYTLGDSRCTKNLSAFSFTTTVTSVSSARKVFVASGLAGHGVDYFAMGVAHFTSGNNAGGKFEIRNSTNSGEITFFIPVPFDVQVGDHVIAIAGCDKRSITCKNKFNNLVNHGGFPFVPGNDSMLQYPDSKLS